jgi:enterochelin esterase-like enzyme
MRACISAALAGIDLARERTTTRYEVHYQQFAGDHDAISWRGMLADGLIELIGR